MPPRPTQPKTNFFGSHHRNFLLPLQGQVIVQFHNLLQGEFWDPLFAPRLLDPFVLPADGVQNRWRFIGDGFLVVYRQRLDRLQFEAFRHPARQQVFGLDLSLGVFSPGYNDTQNPAGVFSYGGTITVQWEGLPL